jgi:crotonobetainyl-CoA:carnitine CoA-transferase CaiB-like acyl-CoA transferase
MTNLLEGIKVLDFTWHLTGPLSTKALSDAGAEVIRVESRKRPDIQRVGARPKLSQYNTGNLDNAQLSHPKGLSCAKG